MMAEQSKRRQHRGEGEWRALLARFPGSGLSVIEFCRREGVSYSSYFRWRALLGDLLPARVATRALDRAFVDMGILGSAHAPVPGASARMELKLDLGGGVVLHLVRG